MRGVLYVLKQHLDLYRIIALNVNAIKNNGVGKTFFNHVYWLAIQSYAINICKLFEVEKGYELNSIPGILKFLRESQLSCKNVTPIRDFILQRGRKFNEHDVAGVETMIFDDFKLKYKEELNRFKEARDKIFVHAENIQIIISGLPSYDVMEKLLDFGIDFYSSIQASYVGSFPVQHKSDLKSLNSTVNVLKRIGLGEVKTDFVS